jgi:hypothetical protein
MAGDRRASVAGPTDAIAWSRRFRATGSIPSSGPFEVVGSRQLGNVALWPLWMATVGNSGLRRTLCAPKLRLATRVVALVRRLTRGEKLLSTASLSRSALRRDAVPDTGVLTLRVVFQAICDSGECCCGGSLTEPISRRSSSSSLDGRSVFSLQIKGPCPVKKLDQTCQLSRGRTMSASKRLGCRFGRTAIGP